MAGCETRPSPFAGVRLVWIVGRYGLNGGASPAGPRALHFVEKGAAQYTHDETEKVPDGCGLGRDGGVPVGLFLFHDGHGGADAAAESDGGVKR